MTDPTLNLPVSAKMHPATYCLNFCTLQSRKRDGEEAEIDTQESIIIECSFCFFAQTGACDLLIQSPVMSQTETRIFPSGKVYSMSSDLSDCEIVIAQVVQVSGKPGGKVQRYSKVRGSLLRTPESPIGSSLRTPIDRCQRFQVGSSGASEDAKN